MKEAMKVLFFHDLTKRWALSLNRLYELIECDPSFPKPYVVVQHTDMRLYLECDIIEYEKQHTELVQVCVRGRNLRSFL
ncbi:hypothetical protein BAMA111019_11610 [Bacillus manliponensis]